MEWHGVAWHGVVWCGCVYGQLPEFRDVVESENVGVSRGWEDFSNFEVELEVNRSNLTVHHLLTHTSGLPFAMRSSKEDISKVKLFYKPGTQYGYTLGHRVLGWAIRDYWVDTPEGKKAGLKTVHDTYKFLIFDKMGLSDATGFSDSMKVAFGFEGDAGDAAIDSCGADLIKLAVLALRRGRLPNGDVLISEKNWNAWAVPNLLPGGKLSKQLVNWEGADASWHNWNYGGLKEQIMQQSGDFGWNYFGATYYDSKEIGWCGFFSSCLRVTYQHDLAFVMMQRDVADLKKSKPYLVEHFSEMAAFLKCDGTPCAKPGHFSSSVFCQMKSEVLSTSGGPALVNFFRWLRDSPEVDGGSGNILPELVSAGSDRRGLRCVASKKCSWRGRLGGSARAGTEDPPP